MPPAISKRIITPTKSTRKNGMFWKGYEFVYRTKYNPRHVPVILIKVLWGNSEEPRTNYVYLCTGKDDIVIKFYRG